MRTVLFAAVTVSFVLIGCGDDANDHGLQARELAAQAAEYRATLSTDEAATTAPGPDDTGTDTGTGTDSDPDAVASAPTLRSAPDVEPTGVVVQVLALDNTFRPDRIEVKVGDEVLWENRGLNEHDVLYVQDSAAPFGVEPADFQPGAVYSHIFTEPGEFHYYCSIHGNETVGMVGTVVVTD